MPLYSKRKDGSNAFMDTKDTTISKENELDENNFKTSTFPVYSMDLANRAIKAGFPVLEIQPNKKGRKRDKNGKLEKGHNNVYFFENTDEFFQFIMEFWNDLKSKRENSRP